jgi:hypothetical protein
MPYVTELINKIRVRIYENAYLVLATVAKVRPILRSTHCCALLDCAT